MLSSFLCEKLGGGGGGGGGNTGTLCFSSLLYLLADSLKNPIVPMVELLHCCCCCGPWFHLRRKRFQGRMNVDDIQSSQIDSRGCSKQHTCERARLLIDVFVVHPNSLLFSADSFRKGDGGRLHAVVLGGGGGFGWWVV